MLENEGQNSLNREKTKKLSLRAGWVSISTNLFLFGIKYWAGVVSGSVALIADAWHTLSDSLSSLFLILGITFAHKPADKNHPFGHGRYELIVTILIGCLLAGVSYNFFMELSFKYAIRISQTPNNNQHSIF